MEGDAVYFSRRASDERAAADHAASAAARDAHLDMAKRYDELAAAIGSRESRSGLNLVAAR